MLNIGTHPVLTEITLNVAVWSHRQVNPAGTDMGIIVKARVLIHDIGYQ
jgi:hypothetical protein